MSELDNKSIDTEPPETKPPAVATMNGAGDDISELSQRAKLNQERIVLFNYAVGVGLIAFGILIAIFCLVIITYLHLVKSHPKEMLSSNFWHIPLMIAVMASTILFTTLKLSADFGETKPQTDNQTFLSNFPFWQELVDAIKSLKK